MKSYRINITDVKIVRELIELAREAGYEICENYEREPKNWPTFLINSNSYNKISGGKYDHDTITLQEVYELFGKTSVDKEPSYDTF